MHLCLYLYLCPDLDLCLGLCLCPCPCPCLCRGSGGSCADCVQDSGLRGVSVQENAGDASDVGCVHCAAARNHPCRAAGCFHDDAADGGGDGGGCCCDGDGYGPVGCSGFSLPPPPPLPPSLPQCPAHPASPQEDDTEGAFGFDLCLT